MGAQVRILLGEIGHGIQKKSSCLLKLLKDTFSKKLECKTADERQLLVQVQPRPPNITMVRVAKW